MHPREAVPAMARQVQAAIVMLSGCTHAEGHRVCSRCANAAEAKLKLALESATRAGWRGPDVF